MKHQPTLQKLTAVLERALSLLVVFLMLAAAAVWSGRLLGTPIGQTGNGTQRPAAPTATPPDAARLAQLGLGDCRLQPLDSATWRVERGGTDCGLLLSSAPHATGITGFAGPTPLYIYIDHSDTLRAVAPAENAETPDFLARAAHGIFARWLGKSTGDALRAEADAVSGATYTSKALDANLRAALAAHVARYENASAGRHRETGKTVAAIAVVLLGTAAAFVRRRNRWLRPAVLALNVGVLGFWCGQFLSLSLLYGWLSGGPDWRNGLPALLMLVLAVLLALCGRRHHYCTWVCPYGSLQELAWRLPLPKIHVPQAAARWLNRVRIGALGLLLLLLWSGLGAEALGYEPFRAFLVSTAPPAVILLAAVFVVAGIFVPRLWCRALCPLGALLDLAGQEK